MKCILFSLILLTTLSGWAQVGTLSGVVTNQGGKKRIDKAQVALKSVAGEVIKNTSTDANGNFSFQEIPFGNYTLVTSEKSYTEASQKITIAKPEQSVSIALLGTLEYQEIRIIGNVVKEGPVPVAVTKITAKKIQEELASRDLPMLLNGTAGVYATQQGGGDGDARINVRGFDQRNVGVMIDGVPVNDMENGWVYWSNWFGLDAITSTMQVQRGLGATKIAMPSIG
ncbi:MAG: TonB-dependent receptor plug domain-containing protein [Flavobacteriales bacterium]